MQAYGSNARNARKAVKSGVVDMAFALLDSDEGDIDTPEPLIMQILETSLLPAVAQQARTSLPAEVNIPQGQTFGDLLGRALETVNAKNTEANASVKNMIDNAADVHDAMLALHEAEEAIELTVAVRNKVVQAYQEIMGMAL